VSYSQLFSYYYLFSFRVLIVMERSDSHIFHISRFRPTAVTVLQKEWIVTEAGLDGGCAER
jgi:hypothetical protein